VTGVGEIVIMLLAVAALGCALLAAVLWLAWQRSRRSMQALAVRLNVESQMEAATLQTLQAMREAARVYVRRQDL
jgi:ABC-type transport system involved in cytochrome c biogenesis permease subunit